MRDQHGETRCTTHAKSQTHAKDNELARRNRNPTFSDMPDWSEEFTEKFVDDSVFEFRDLHASFAHGPFLESWREVVSVTGIFLQSSPV